MNGVIGIEQTRRRLLKQYTVADIMAMDELVKQDWQKWESVRRELWAMLEELDKLGY